MRPAVPAIQVGEGTQAVGTAKDGISRNNDFFPRARIAPPSDSSPSFWLGHKVYIIFVIGSYQFTRCQEVE